MAKIIKKTSTGYSVAEYKINWKRELKPILRKRYSESQTSKFIKTICSNSIFAPALRDDEKLKLVKENGENVFYQLNRDGWRFRGKVTDFLIKEEQLDFIASKVNKNIAQELKEEVLRIQNSALDSLKYEPFYLLDEDGTTVPEDGSFFKAAKGVVTKYFSDECADTVVKEVAEYLFNTKNIENGSFVVLFDKKRTTVMADMKNVFPYQDDENLKMYIKETEPGINAEEFCRKIVVECIELPKTMKADGKYVYRKIGSLELKKVIGEEEWQLTEESCEILKKELEETEFDEDRYDDETKDWVLKANRPLKCLPKEALFKLGNYGDLYRVYYKEEKMILAEKNTRREDEFQLEGRWWNWNKFLKYLYG